MKRRSLALAIVSITAVSGCSSLTENQANELGAGLFGAGAAGIAANALGADRGGVFIASAVGAAAGVAISQNAQKSQEVSE